MPVVYNPQEDDSTQAGEEALAANTLNGDPVDSITDPDAPVIQPS